jgi:hypothetical protein
MLIMINNFNIEDEEFRVAMKEFNDHCIVSDCVELIYRDGLLSVLKSLSDYTSDPKVSYALAVLAKMYKENEVAICKDAPTMQ